MVLFWLPAAAITALPVDLAAVELVSNTPAFNNGDIQEIAHLSSTKGIEGLAWSPDGKYLAAISFWGSTLTIWETNTWTKIREFVRREGGAIVDEGFWFSSNETVLTSTMLRSSFDPNYKDMSMSFNVMEWDIRTGKYVRCLPATPIQLATPRDRSRMERLTVSSDQRLAAGVYGELAHTLSVLDIATGKMVFAHPIPIDWGIDLSESINSKTELIWAVSFSADGRLLAVGTSSEQNTKKHKTLAAGGRVYIIDSMTGKTLNSFWAYRWKPDHELDSPDEDGFIKYRPKDIYQVRTIALSPDGQWVVTGKDRDMCNTRTGNRIAATIWNARTGARIIDLEGDVHEDKVLDMVLVTPIVAMAWQDDWLAMINHIGSCRLYSLQDPSRPKLLFKSKADYTGYSPTLAVSKNGLVAYCNGLNIHVLQINNH
jgi:WD40 repeat protein